MKQLSSKEDKWILSSEETAEGKQRCSLDVISYTAELHFLTFIGNDILLAMLGKA